MLVNFDSVIFNVLHVCFIHYVIILLFHCHLDLCFGRQLRGWLLLTLIQLPTLLIVHFEKLAIEDLGSDDQTGNLNLCLETSDSLNSKLLIKFIFNI